MAIKINNDTVIDNSKNINAGIGTFTELDVPPIPISFSPSDGATEVAIGTNIVITFNQLIIKGTGNITLRDGSAGGTVLQTIDVTSGNVTISGGVATISPPSALALNTNVYVVVDAGAFVASVGGNNAIINTYDFTTANAPPLGDAYEGGFLICTASPVRWVVSPFSAEVSRCYYVRTDANTRAQQVSGCTGWFVPSVPQLQNPGYCCRSFWGPSPCFSVTNYWSNSQSNTTNGAFVRFTNGTSHYDFGSCNSAANKLSIYCIRSFRCVTY